MKGADIDALFRRAARSGKRAKYVITFDDYGIVLEGEVHR